MTVEKEQRQFDFQMQDAVSIRRDRVTEALQKRLSNLAKNPVSDPRVKCLGLLDNEEIALQTGDFDSRSIANRTPERGMPQRTPMTKGKEKSSF